jgi:hypothetical protein
MDDDVELVRHLYDRFNARDIDGVLAGLADDVAWANAMDGGYVHGHAAAREYWTRHGPWSVRTSSLWAFVELRTARSSQRSGKPSAISKAIRFGGKRTG